MTKTPARPRKADPIPHQRFDRVYKRLVALRKKAARLAAPARVFCASCQRWLEHNQEYCPLFPAVAVKPRMWDLGSGEKWKECVCLVHTCFGAKKVKDRRTAATYRD